MSIEFKKATRAKVKLKILIDGPSGSGKTIGAIHTARGIVGTAGKIAVIDSERDRSEYYADRYDFDKLSLTELKCENYGQALQAAIDAGYEAVVIDSLSHAWLNLLERKDTFDAANPSSNRWTNWAKFTPEWDKLIRFILECPVHVICTARSKQSHEQVEDGGKKKVVKLGLAPQIRENTEYEFAVTFSLNESHSGEATKDNTFLFGDKKEPIDLLNGKVCKKLNEWLSTAADAPVSPKPPQGESASTKIKNTLVATLNSVKSITELDTAKKAFKANFDKLTPDDQKAVIEAGKLRRDVLTADAAIRAEHGPGSTEPENN